VSKPIDILAGLKKSTKSGRSTIQITADEVWFNPDEKSITGPLAEVIARTIGDNLRKGLNPSGAPMPGISMRTRDWRDNEAELAARGGQADPRIKDPRKRAAVAKNFHKDYHAPRLGAFTPESGGPRGVVSGMLADSFLARPNNDGKSFTVYVAAKRGKPRPGETLSAVESVFRGVPLWSEQAMQQPAMRKAMQESADRMVNKNQKQLLQEVKKLMGAIRGLVDQAD
jgi:hypothetical protein